MSFSSEQELVEYALEKLPADKWNKAHLVMIEEKAVESLLKK